MKKGVLKRLSSVVLIFAMTLTLFVVPQVSATVVEKNASVARQVANEGIVLLKNENNALPLSNVTPEKVAVFGQGQVFDGTVTAGFQTAGDGSADDSPVTVIDPFDAFTALETAGRIDLYEELSAEYVANLAYVPDDAMYTAVGENADTAVVIITRNPSATNDREAADWYLTDAEKTMLKKLTALKTSGALNKIIVVLNIGSTLDTAWAKDGNPDGINVDAVLSAWYPGEQGGNAIADTLIGDSNPSGKLSDTFAVSLDDYGFSLSRANETYSEDIFVGYRYFETFGIPVSYPFGYGLSYTTFNFGTPTYSVADGKITVSVDVTNTGSAPGKEVVQVYYSAPQKGVGSALMSKASVELAAFKKTGLIQPGATETVTITYDVNDMASYDDEGVTGNKSAYVLEAGDYKVYVGNSVKEAQTRLAGTYNVSSLTVTEQLNQYLAPKTAFNKTVVNNNNGVITKGTQAALTGTDEDVADRSYTPYTGEAAADVIPFDDVLTGKATYEQFVGQMSVDELVALTVGHPRVSGVSDGSSKAVIGAGEAINAKYGIPAADTFNGPCGIQINTKATSFGSEVLMACTWNTDLIYEAGKSMGKEAAVSGADILLTTSMNIHRHPLNGRHFEYFSEDPVLMGEMGSSQMLGIQSQGVTVTLKHFALYNKRYPQAQDVSVTERAAREIYLKGFEIAVKDSVAAGNPLAMMSSYGKINGTYASEIKGLMTGILRDEWGFDGLVMSDWGAAANAANSFIAGNNIKVPSSSTATNESSNTQRQSYIDSVTSAYNAGTITRNMLELNAIDILKVLAALPDAYVDILPISRVYVSSTYADNTSKPKTISNLSDNDKETDWAGLGETKFANRLIVDFGKAIPVRLVEFVSARMTNFRNDFTMYLSNDNEFLEKDVLYNYVAGGQGVTYRVVPATVDTIKSDKYRYLVIDGNAVNTKIGMSELRVYANATDAIMTDNSLINITDLTPGSSFSTSTAYAGWSASRATDMSANTEFITAQGHYNKDEYVFVDLGSAKKVDSLSLLIGTSSGRGNPDGVLIDPAYLRTDFDIVARNDNNFTKTEDETVLINYTGTLGPDTGDSSGLCILEVPDEYKNTEFRYIGIRKVPTAANNNVGQICITEMGVYAKASDYPYSYQRPTATYDKATGAISISTVARTIQDKAYKFVVAGYDDEGTLAEVKFVDLKKPSESARTEKETEVQGIGYATSITKSVVFDNHLNIAYAKVMLLSDLGSISPLTKAAEVELNPEYKAQLLKDPVLNYMKAEFDTASVISFSGSANPKTYYDDQNPVTIEWDAVNGATSYTFTLSTNEDYSDGKEYTTNTNSVTVTNLYVAERYFWKAVANNGTEVTGSFKTQEYAPRYITTETVSNLRDLGGWMTESGKRVNQGLMFRGAELTDDDGKNSYLRGTIAQLSDNDLDLMANELGIKTEFDLRGSENGTRTTSPLGDDVAYYDKSLGSNDYIIAADYGTLKDIFTVMADESNYPIFFHCVGGNDRTARLAFLVNGLLGVSKEDLIRDWELSSFSFNTVRRRNDSSYWAGFNGFIESIEAEEGNSLSEKIENVLINKIGLTQEQVDSIKDIMLD